MKNKRQANHIITKPASFSQSAKSARSEPGKTWALAYPALLEPALEEMVAGLNSRRRRVLAARFQKWASQLFLSAQLLDKVESYPPSIVPLDELVCLDDPSFEVNGKTARESLQELARLEKLCCDIRLGLTVAGVIVQPDPFESENRAKIFPN